MVRASVVRSLIIGLAVFVDLLVFFWRNDTTNCVASAMTMVLPLLAFMVCKACQPLLRLVVMVVMWLLAFLFLLVLHHQP